MPELPDVEVSRRYLDATALHQPVAHTHVEDSAVLSGTTPQGLGRALSHQSFLSTQRHGKYLLVELERRGWMVLHFGMTGSIKYFKARGDAPRYTQVLFSFDNGFHLAYIAPRKLGAVGLADNPQALAAAHHLGPDALDADLDRFRELAAGRRGAVKSWLMDQQSLAGIGNVYSDEILFQAGIHPKRPVHKLDDSEIARLHEQLRDVLCAAIDAEADPARMPDHFLLPRRRPGAECPRCSGTVQTIKAGGRTAWFCPTCQHA
jgi:formamidopyrimidine-DNA glycosylase